jgi:Lrp/AsnC family transcriptional regulator for asnA, asnC and gidA
LFFYEYYIIIIHNCENRNTGGIFVDSIDYKILLILQKDGRTSFTDIAKELDISEGTVRNRLARLLENDIVQIVGLIAPSQLGFDAPAMINVSVEPTKLESAAAEIATMPEVSYLVMVSGECDLIVEVMCRNREALAAFLNQRLRLVPGVTRTQTSLILRTFKMAYGARPSTSNPPDGDAYGE